MAHDPKRDIPRICKTHGDIFYVPNRFSVVGCCQTERNRIYQKRFYYRHRLEILEKKRLQRREQGKRDQKRYDRVHLEGAGRSGGQLPAPSV